MYILIKSKNYIYQKLLGLTSYNKTFTKTILSNLQFSKNFTDKINESLIRKDKNNTYKKEGSKDNNFLITNNDRDLSLTKEKVDKYLSLVDKHKNFEIPFTNIFFYREILELNNSIKDNQELETWPILDEYIELNIETIDKSFFLDSIESFAKIKYWKFKFWYYCENKIIEDYEAYENFELAKIIYSFSYAEKGSDYLYNSFAKELMKRKISKLTEKEFILIYNAFTKVKIDNKIFNLILEKAREEKFNYLN